MNTDVSIEHTLHSRLKIYAVMIRIYDEYQMLEDRFKSIEAKLWTTVDRAEKAEAKHAALVEAVDKYIESYGTIYDLEELEIALAAAQEQDA